MENKLLINKHILFCNYIDKHYKDKSLEINYLKNNFCGNVVYDINELKNYDDDCVIYTFGNVEYLLRLIRIDNNINKFLNFITELSFNYHVSWNKRISFISLGQIPINLHNQGVLFRNFFNNDKNYFEQLNAEHEFQLLTESNKPGTSYRKGIYITNVTQDNDNLYFNLLRCSTNLDGPTDNFRSTDNEIIHQINNTSKLFFEQETQLNHVLAQVYNNISIDGKEKKARIKQHSDKTKDMPTNGLIVFCTFYQFDNVNVKQIKKPNDDPYDLYYKDASVLTRLRFRLKKDVNDTNLAKTFDVMLYPNSVFIISLSTNRLYTHEIVPSHLPVDKLPTRLGYVIRCSNTKAMFKDNQTYIINNEKEIKLELPTNDKVKKLKDMYFKENITSEFITYDNINFSLNQGDYMKPNI